MCFETNHVQIHVNTIAEYFLLKTAMKKRRFKISGVFDITNYLVTNHACMPVGVSLF